MIFCLQTNLWIFFLKNLWSFFFNLVKNIELNINFKLIKLKVNGLNWFNKSRFVLITAMFCVLVSWKSNPWKLNLLHINYMNYNHNNFYNFVNFLLLLSFFVSQTKIIKDRLTVIKSKLIFYQFGFMRLHTIHTIHIRSSYMNGMNKVVLIISLCFTWIISTWYYIYNVCIMYLYLQFS